MANKYFHNLILFKVKNNYFEIHIDLSNSLKILI